MRRVGSKSVISHSKKESLGAAESRKSSRVVRGNSCVKINSIQTEQTNHNYSKICSGSTQLAKSNLHTLSQKLIAKMPGPVHLDKPNQSHRQTQRTQLAKSSI